jgi:hypothetical protein
MWNEGITIGAIAECFGVAIYEMALLVIHCELEGLILPREGWIDRDDSKEKEDLI